MTQHSTLLWQKDLSVDRLTLLINWISDRPTTAAAVIALCGGGALSAADFLMSQRLFTRSVRSSHNNVAGYIFGIMGGIYSVLLAFIAVAAWRKFSQAEHLVETEANLVGDLYRDSIVLPEPAASRKRRYLFDYAVVVVQDEWPALAAGRAAEGTGWQLLDQVHAEVLAIATVFGLLTLSIAVQLRRLNLAR